MPAKNFFEKYLLFVFVIVWLFSACTEPMATNFSIVPSGTPMLVATITSTPTAIDIQTPTETPEPDIWQVHECPKNSNVIALDNDWINLYKGKVEGRGELTMLLNTTVNNGIQGFAFDSGQAIEYKVIGCLQEQEQTFTMWLMREDNVDAVIQGKIPPDNVLSIEEFEGSMLQKSQMEQSTIYLHFTRSTPGTMQHRFKLADVQDDSIILNAVQNFLTSVTNGNHTQVVEMMHFPVEAHYGGELHNIQSPEAFLSQYDSIFGNGFIERLPVFPDYLVVDTENTAGAINMSVYDGGGITFDEYGKIIAIYNWQESELFSEAEDSYTSNPSPRFPPSCGTVKLGQPGTQQLNDWNAPGLLVHGTAILCTDYMILAGDEPSAFEPVLHAMFDLDSGKTNIELADMIFEVYGREGFFYISDTNGTQSESWTLEADKNLNFNEPPQPTYDQCKEQYSDPLRTDNEPIYLCVITGEGHVSRVKVEKFNPIDRVLSVEISFVTWKEKVTLP